MMTEGAQWNAQHDKLTGLPNRELFEQRLQQAIDVSGDGHKPLAVFYADLDRFKIINDTLGQEVGDSLLNAVAERLSKLVDGRGLVARMGGDEFTVLVDLVWSREEADSLARELLVCFETPFNARGQELFVSASIGCSMFPWDGEDVQTLRRNADTAMYRAKGSGRNRFLQFAPMMISGLERRLKIQNQLHRALGRQELSLFYQPQHDLKDDRMIGVEALLRWTARDLGVVNPGEFIPVAEESGLIVEIGTWVLKEACRQCRRWYDDGHLLRVAVNVSAWQFARPDFVETVQHVLHETGIPAELLELELTETVLMQESGGARADLERLSQIGVQVSVDDFGTGYSSLAYLQLLPIHSLKIDLSFVRSIPENENVPPLITAITAVARGLNINVIAEGVERQYQARVLRRAGCDRVQGYLYGRPVPADELTRLLATDCRPSTIAAGAN
jgi:diguanylate cyclase (GGDEF)-like protein